MIGVGLAAGLLARNLRIGDLEGGPASAHLAPAIPFVAVLALADVLLTALRTDTVGLPPAVFGLPRRARTHSLCQQKPVAPYLGADLIVEEGLAVVPLPAPVLLLLRKLIGERQAEEVGQLVGAGCQQHGFFAARDLAVIHAFLHQPLHGLHDDLAPRHRLLDVHHGHEAGQLAAAVIHGASRGPRRNSAAPVAVAARDRHHGSVILLVVVLAVYLTGFSLRRGGHWHARLGFPILPV